ncbi:MAG: PspC domain-containing protein [Candidatus Hydrogenedentes bacterium]|nr:PspC domain-containing protein [Candidatus Hydrogenedentota bacterium]
MMLTQRQQMLIARYLREVADALGDVGDDTRERVLRQVKNRVMAGLGKNDGVVADEEVVAALASLGTPASQVTESAQGTGGHDGLTLSTDNRRWLGVCGGVADYLGLSATAVRTFFILLGVTGPLGMIVYIALYAEMYVASDRDRAPRIDFWRLLGRTLSTLVAIVALDVGVRGLLLLVRRAYERFAGLGPIPDLGQWNWLPLNAPVLLFCTLSLSVPLAILSGLPMANQWDRTLKHCAQAILALYAATLSIGVALFLTGLIIRVAKGIAL